MFQLFKYVRFTPVAVLLILSTSCGHTNPEIKGANLKPVRVKVMSAIQSNGVASDSYSGTIEAGSATTPSFKVPGTITQIKVEEGQPVKQGQLIATVDGSSLKNSYDIAQAALREAQDAYNRMKKLHDAEAIPDMQWVSVQEQLKQAEAACAIACTEMNDANLYAPVSGVVSRKIAEVGQTAAPGVPIVEILNLDLMKVKISVTESELASMNVGAKAAISNAGQVYTGTLIEKGVAANPLSRNYDIKFKIDNPDSYLHPGMICSVSVEGLEPKTDTEKTAEIILPPQAVVLDWDNTNYVWLKKDGVALRHKVDISGLDSRGIVVSGGLAATDSVIVEGQQKLSTGLKVEPIN